MSKQVTITLNQIKNNDVSKELLNKILEIHCPTDLDYDKPFPLSKVLDIGSLNEVIMCFRVLPEHRRVFVKFALFCAKSANMHTCSYQVHDCIAKTEKYIEGNGSRKELLIAINKASNSTCVSTTAAIQVAKYVLASFKDPKAFVYPTAVVYAANVAAHSAYVTCRHVPNVHAYGAPSFVCDTLSAHTARSREIQKQIEYLRELLDGEEYVKPKTYKSQLKTWLKAFLIKLLKIYERWKWKN